jgi:uncharacterized damage-inducible protein DinB
MVLQLREELPGHLTGLTLAQWNARPSGVASVAFHVRHIPGVLDRMAAYARAGRLDETQKATLATEAEPLVDDQRSALQMRVDSQVDAYLDVLRSTDPLTLGDFRGVGRGGLPSSVIGCLMHGAEHGMRHLGQLIVTARVLRNG